MPPQNKPALDPDTFMQQWSGTPAPNKNLDVDSFMASHQSAVGPYRPPGFEQLKQRVEAYPQTPQGIPENYGFTLGNMLQNAWEGASGLVKGTYELGKDLVQNPNRVSGPDSTLQKFVINPSEQQTIQAGQALNQGQTLPAVGHALASAIPFVGPWAAGVGQQAGTGDIGGALAGAGGALATGAAMGAVAKGVGGVTKALPRGSIEEITGTTPERIAELEKVPKRMANVQKLAVKAESSVKAKAAQQFPKITEPIILSKETVNVPTGILDKDGNPVMRSEEVVKKTTFKDLQRQYSELGQQIADEKQAVMSGKAAFDLKDLVIQRQKVNDMMTEAAKKSGKLDELNNARQEWKAFEDAFHNPNSPVKPLLRMAPDQTAEIASHLSGRTNAARMVEIFRKYGISPQAIQTLLSEGRKPLAVDVRESSKLRAAGSPEAYRMQRLRESLRQATVNELPAGAEARLPAWSMSRRLPGIFSQIPVGPRQITAWRLRNAIENAGKP